MALEKFRGKLTISSQSKKQDIEQGEIWLDTLLIPADKLNGNMKNWRLVFLMILVSFFLANEIIAIGMDTD